MVRRRSTVRFRKGAPLCHLTWAYVSPLPGVTLRMPADTDYGDGVRKNAAEQERQMIARSEVQELQRCRADKLRLSDLETRRRSCDSAIDLAAPSGSGRRWQPVVPDVSWPPVLFEHGEWRRLITGISASGREGPRI
jgi:hypothetical protein